MTRGLGWCLGALSMLLRLQWGCRWRRPDRIGDGVGSLGKSSRFMLLTQPESGLSVYGYGDSYDQGFRAAPDDFTR